MLQRESSFGCFCPFTWWWFCLLEPLGEVYYWLLLHIVWICGFQAIAVCILQVEASGPPFGSHGSPSILQRSAPRWLSSLARKIGSTQLLGFNWVKNGEDVPGLENHTLFKFVSSFFESNEPYEKKHRIFGIGRAKCEIWMNTTASAVLNSECKGESIPLGFSLRCTKLSWTN